MLVVVPTYEGVLELNWTWLPSFMGLDASLRETLRLHLAGKYEGRAMSDETLQEAHADVVAFLKDRYPALLGLDRFFDALQHVEIMK